MMMRSLWGQGSAGPAALFVCLAGLLCAAMLTGCSSNGKEPPPGTTALTIKNNAGKTQTIFIEIAATPEERGKGLSFRTELPEDRGMLFIIPQKGAGFWMKEALIPLSVAFIGRCGEIVHIADMEPQTETLHNTEHDYKFGLEANKGWFARRGIGIGSTVEIPEEYRYADCARG